MLVKIANREDPVQAAFSLILGRAVCIGLFCRQLVFKILEHLKWACSNFSIYVNHSNYSCIIRYQQRPCFNTCVR